MFQSGIEPLEAFRGRKVTVMGLGLFGGGVGVTKFLCQVGAIVTVTDQRAPEVLAEAMKELEGLRIQWVLGQHRETDFTKTDLVIPSPAVPRDSPYLRLSVQSRVPLETEMNLFFKYCPAKICGVTGTNGKTTTTSLLGAIASTAWPDTLIGGNLGKSLLPQVTEIRPDQWAVLELSSFQLEDLACLERRPEVSVVTNLSPNHLNRHGSYDHYIAAKKVIVEPGPEPNVAILNGEDSRVRSWSHPRRRSLFFGRTGDVLPRASGVWIDTKKGQVYLKAGSQAEVLFMTKDLALPGNFNLLNAAAAAAGAAAMGVPHRVFPEAIRSFRTVEHRLEPFFETNGVRFFDDSIATNPESTIAALEALGPRVVLICGGAHGGDRSYAALGQAIARRTQCVILVGQTAREIGAAIPRRLRGPRVRRVESFEQAVSTAIEQAKSGDKVLLSPACASYDMFVNFVERGKRFKTLVRNASLGIVSH